jgi:hypothetical protein
MDSRIWSRRSSHGFTGFDRVGHSCAATCACGWSSDLKYTEDRALVAFGVHRAKGWAPTGRRRP